ncbi:formate dehydrogenase accessory sulfurtransferase FdhD [Halopseudomonas nanhaiensis]|uniref:formate dehydrogenase accessory sulfurtransferase FdhD n=1 Tax=Halopseudomonas nanhaiensis TaxID=2830842 RepID=UPI001CBEBAFE|nr:formate dehydrogenase accessory sulfurtransferase FdhD [Halopseudomonas nanhaiensis]UAW97763.1 formate dehydrogenase accessory sulfurtransferase FdhD [Halopseudomonas nanhaiensis]
MPADFVSATPVRRAVEVEVVSLKDHALTARRDRVAVEQALEIRVAGADPVITMRTPGNDLELAAGLLLSEGLVRNPADFHTLTQLVDQPDIVQVVLSGEGGEQGRVLQRSSLSNSACGVCGKSKLNLESMSGLPRLSEGEPVSAELLAALPARLREHQAVFDRTGGLHAAALFTLDGTLLALREDVGRHNAMDKLNGWALFEGKLPLTDRIVVLSGRASFELIQKCVMSRAAVVCAISAPSSYAVDLAEQTGITLVGFLREGRFNIYSHPERILSAVA